MNARGTRDVLANRLRESFAGDVSEAIQEEEGNSTSLSSINDSEGSTSGGDAASVRGAGSLVLSYWTEEIDLLPSESDEPSFLHSVETSVSSSDEPSVLQTDELSVLPSDGPRILLPDEPCILTSHEPTVLTSDESSVLPSNEERVFDLSDLSWIEPSVLPPVLSLDDSSVLPSDVVITVLHFFLRSGRFGHRC